MSDHVAIRCHKGQEDTQDSLSQLQRESGYGSSLMLVEQNLHDASHKPFADATTRTLGFDGPDWRLESTEPDNSSTPWPPEQAEAQTGIEMGTHLGKLNSNKSKVYAGESKRRREWTSQDSAICLSLSPHSSKRNSVNSDIITASSATTSIELACVEQPADHNEPIAVPYPHSYVRRYPRRESRPLSGSMFAAAAQDSRSGSMDSAIDLDDSSRRSSYDPRRLSSYDTIKEDCETPHCIESLSYPVSKTPVVHTVNFTDADIEEKPAGNKTPHMVRLICKALRVASFCIPLPRTKPKEAHDALGIVNKSYEPQSHSEKDDLLESFQKSYQHSLDEGLDVVGRSVQTPNFAAAYLDSRGGCLMIDESCVHLYVPPGALPAEGPPKRVYIYVKGSSANSSNNCVTPTVHCGPSNLNFRKDVMLTIPHCAKDANSCQFTSSKTSSAGRKEFKDDGEDGIVLIDAKTILITMDHFCEYAATVTPLFPGTTFAKSMTACVFMRRSEHKEEIQVRLWLFDETPPRFREVQEKEQERGFGQVWPSTKLEVHYPAGDMVVTLTSREATWRLDPNLESSSKKISGFTLGDRGHTTTSTWVVFLVKSTGSPSTKPFEASMKVFQENREEHGVEFFVHKQAPAKLALSVLPTFNFKEQFKQTPAGQIHESIIGMLRDKLDDGDHPVLNWRFLPENLKMAGCGAGFVAQIERRVKIKQHLSPTEEVIHTFCAQENRSGGNQIMVKLREGLVEMEKVRPDMKDVIVEIDEQLIEPNKNAAEGGVQMHNHSDHNANNSYTTNCHKNNGREDGKQDSAYVFCAPENRSGGNQIKVKLREGLVEMEKVRPDMKEVIVEIDKQLIEPDKNAAEGGVQMRNHSDHNANNSYTTNCHKNNGREDGNKDSAYVSGQDFGPLQTNQSCSYLTFEI